MPTFLRELFELYAKRLIMKGGQGIKQIPNKDRVKLMADNLYKDFKKAGIPDEIIQTENDIKVFHHKIAEVQQENAIRAISADSAEGRKITEGLFGKPKAQVFDLKGNKIKNPQNIMGGQEIKVDIVADTIATIKSKKPIDAMKEANSVIGRKGVYKNLTPDQSKKILKDTEDHIFERDIPIDPEDMADGGVAGLLGERQNFAMGKRAFLKLMGGVGAGIAGLKSGLLGFGGKQATKKAVTETVKQTAGSGTPPPYFINLVKKIKNLGDDAPNLVTQDRQKVTKFKDYTLTEDITTGSKEVIKKNSDGVDEVYMKHSVEDVPTKKGLKKSEEYEELTAKPDMEGKMKDIEQGVPDEVVQEGTIFEDTLSEFGKADGGRIGYGIGGLSKLGITGSSRRFLEKIFGKGNLDEMIKRDPEMHRGLLEVTEMFRNRDKEGLKMYMQKFLPHMDDTEIEEFIIGDAVDSAGQAKFGLGDMQGQLIRLGSGRDYKAKIEAIKKLEDAQKLDTLDVTEEMIRKPNAFGGIQTMLGE